MVAELNGAARTNLIGGGLGHPGLELELETANRTELPLKERGKFLRGHAA
jgi:hypothetical protein